MENESDNYNYLYSSFLSCCGYRDFIERINLCFVEIPAVNKHFWGATKLCKRTRGDFCFLRDFCRIRIMKSYTFRSSYLFNLPLTRFHHISSETPSHTTSTSTKASNNQNQGDVRKFFSGFFV